jgi:hypothetical protein
MLRVKNKRVTGTHREIDRPSDGLVARDTKMRLVIKRLVVGVGVETDAVAGDDKPHRDPNIDRG